MLLEDQVVPEAKSVSPCIKEPEYEEGCRARFWRLKMVKLYGGRWCVSRLRRLRFDQAWAIDFSR
jgi:hypothetical protein